MYPKSMIFLTAIAIGAALSGCAADRARKAKLEKPQEPKEQQQKAKKAQYDAYYDATSKRWRTWDGRLCRSCTPQNGYSTPVVKDEDMYYDPAIRKWRQSSMKGGVCHTCTPQYGYPIPPK